MNADASSPAAPKPAARRKTTAPKDAQFQVAVIGAGFSGLCMAIQLKLAKINSFVVFEKADDIGGTWRDNLYPGCACDVPSHLYSYSFEPNPNWSRMFAPAAGNLGLPASLRPQVRRHRTHALQCRGRQRRVRHRPSLLARHAQSGETVTAKIVVSGIGALSIPAYPKLPGIENFKGTAFHCRAGATTTTSTASGGGDRHGRKRDPSRPG